MSDTGEAYEFSRTVRVGRSDDCDIVVDDPHVSRLHAEIVCTAAGWVTNDVSMNGTTINGETGVRRPLAVGDCLRVGPRSFAVVAVS